MTDLPDAADRAHNAVTDEGVFRIMAALLRQCEGELREVRAENERLGNLLDTTFDAADKEQRELRAKVKSRGELVNKWYRRYKRADRKRMEAEAVLEEIRTEAETRIDDTRAVWAAWLLARIDDAGMGASGDAVDWREEARWATAELESALDEIERLRRCAGEARRANRSKQVNLQTENTLLRFARDWWKSKAVEQEREAARLRKHVDNLETVLEAETNASLIYQESLAQVSCENEKLRANDPGLSRLLAAALRQCEGQLREARAVRDELRADNERLRRELLEEAHQLQDAFGDIERLEDQLSAAHDEIRRLRAANDRHHGYWIDAIRERDALQAQLDAGLDDCLEMHAAFVAVKRERDKLRAIVGEGAL